MIGGNSVVRWSTRTAGIHGSRPDAGPPGSDELLDLDVAERDAAGVRLQSDEARPGIGHAAVGIAVDEIGLLLAVEQYRDPVVLHADLEPVPLAGRHRHDVFMGVLTGNVVDRAGRAEFLVDLLARRRAAASERVDLDLEAEIHRHESGVVVALRGRIRETDEDSG